MRAVLKKEIQFFLNNPIGYITIILFAVFANFLFVKDIFVIGEASLRPFFNLLPWIMMIFIPALAMRSFAEEKRTNTLELLLSLPLSEIQIVLAKFFAYCFLVLIGLALTLSLPISINLLTTAAGSSIYLPELFTSYLGALLVGSLYVAITMFFSSQTDNQVVAFLGSALVLFFLIIFSTDFVAGFLPRLIQDGLNYLSPVTHFNQFIKGVVDLRSVVYFLTVDALFLFLTVISLERRQ